MYVYYTWVLIRWLASLFREGNSVWLRAYRGKIEQQEVGRETVYSLGGNGFCL